MLRITEPYSKYMCFVSAPQFFPFHAQEILTLMFWAFIQFEGPFIILGLVTNSFSNFIYPSRLQQIYNLSWTNTSVLYLWTENYNKIVIFVCSPSPAFKVMIWDFFPLDTDWASNVGLRLLFSFWPYSNLVSDPSKLETVALTQAKIQKGRDQLNLFYLSTGS